MNPLYIILILIAFVCFVAAAVFALAPARRDRVNTLSVALLAVGLAAWSLIEVIQRLRAG